MLNDLLVECPIHLDAVPITDILVFKCGHGFCEPCLEGHLTHNAQSSELSCPTCRKPVRRKEAFPLFLAPAQPSIGATRSSHSTQESSHIRVMRELREAKAAHTNCSARFTDLQNEIDGLRQDGAYDNQMMQHLRGRYELLEERFAKEVDNSARARQESDRMKEEATKLQVENHKTSKALEQALEEVQAQLERVKMFQGYIERYKRKCNLERRKRKAIESANHNRKEDNSLMVVDANAPDVLHQDGPNFGWLDEACKVKGDQLTTQGDEDLESEKGSEDDVQLNDLDTNIKRREDWQTPGPSVLRSDWNLGLETLGPSSGITRKQRHGSKQVGRSRIIKVKIPPVKTGTSKLVGPLAIDRQGRINGLVALGPRQKLNSKN